MNLHCCFGNEQTAGVCIVGQSGDHLQHRILRGSELYRSAVGGLLRRLIVPSCLEGPVSSVCLNHNKLAGNRCCRVTHASMHAIAGVYGPSVHQLTDNVCASVPSFCMVCTRRRSRKFCPHLCPLSASPTVLWGQRVDLIALGSPSNKFGYQSCTAKATPQVASLTA